MFSLLQGEVRYHAKFSWNTASNAKLNILYFINKLVDVSSLMGCSFQQLMWSERCFSILERIMSILSLNSWSLLCYLPDHKFNMPKCQILNLGQSYTGHKYKLWEEWLESRPAERNLGVLDLDSVSVRVSSVPWQPREQTALGCIKHSMASWAKEGIIPLYLVLMWPHLGHWAQFCAPPFKKDVQVLGCGQRRRTHLVKGWESPFCQEWLRALGLICGEQWQDPRERPGVVSGEE